jgi:C4-dicarboxylate transporter, DctQ subunit
MENSIVTVGKQSSPNRISKTFKWIDYWILEGLEKFIISFGLLALTIIVFGVVLTRYFFGYSPDWSDELPRFIVIWVTFIGMSYCVRKGEHVVIDILFNKLKGKIQKFFYLCILTLCFLTFVYMTYIGYGLVVKIFSTNQMSVTLGIPMGYVYLAVPVGCFLTAKNFFHLIIKNLSSKDVHLDLNGREI